VLGYVVGAAADGGSEAVTEILQSTTSAMMDVNPDAMQGLGERSLRAAAIGAIMSASANAIPTAAEFIQNPSRSNARKAGIPPEAANSKRQREEIAQQAQAMMPEDTELQRIQDVYSKAAPNSNAKIRRHKDGWYAVDLEHGTLRIELSSTMRVRESDVPYVAQAYGMEPTPENLDKVRNFVVDGAYQFKDSDGKTWDGLGLIKLADKADSGELSANFRHELVHMAVRTGLFNTEELKSIVGKYKIQGPNGERWKKPDLNSDTKEGRLALEEYVATVAGLKGGKNPVMDSIREWLDKLLQLVGLPSRRNTAEQDLFLGSRLKAGTPSQESVPAATPEPVAPPVAPAIAPAAPQQPASPVLEQSGPPVAAPQRATPVELQVPDGFSGAPPVESTSVTSEVSDSKEIGVKHAKTAELRERHNLPPYERGPASTAEAMEQQSIDEKVPERALDIAAELIENPRQLTDIETIGFNLKLVELENAYDAATANIQSLGDKAQPSHFAMLDRIEGEIELLVRASDPAGTMWGRAGFARRLTIDRHKSFVTVKAEAKTKKGDSESLTDKEESGLKKVYEKHDRNRKRLAALEAKEKKKQHREVARLKSAVSNIRQIVGLDPQKLGNVDVPGLTAEEQAAVTGLRKKLDEAEKQLAAMESLPALDRVNNRPSEKIISELDDAVAKVRSMIAAKTKRAKPTPTDAELEARKVAAIERQIETIEKELQGPENIQQFKYDVASERRTELKKQLQDLQANLKVKQPTPSSLVEDRRIDSLKKQIAKADEDIADLKQGLPALKSTGYDAASKERAKLKEELSQRRKIIAELTPRREPTSAEVEHRRIASLEKQLATIEEQIASPEKVQQFDFDVASKRRTELKSEISAARKRLREKQPPPSSLIEDRKIVALQRALEKTQQDLANAKKGILPAKKPKQADVITEQRNKLQDEVRRSRQELRNAIASLEPKDWTFYLKEFNLFQLALQAGYDLSAIGKQALPAIGYPKVFAQGVARSLRAAKTERYFKQHYRKIINDPLYPEFMRVGGDIMDIDADANIQEEFVASRLLHKIPGGAASQRAFLALLNDIRFNMYKAQRKLGGNLTEHELKIVAHQVNMMTGRGHAKVLDKSMPTLSIFLWAPRLALSRLQFYSGYNLIRGTNNTRKIVGIMYARSIVGMFLWKALWESIYGDDEPKELDPRSNMFLKTTGGDVTIDSAGGFAQTGRLAAQIISKQEKDETGRIKQLGPYDLERKLFRFARSKFSPSMQLGFDLATRGSYIYENRDITTGEGLTAILTSRLPLSLQGTLEVLQVEGGIPRKIGLVMLNAIGNSVSVVNDRESGLKQPTRPQRPARPSRPTR